MKKNSTIILTIVGSLLAVIAGLVIAYFVTSKKVLRFNLED